MPPPIILARSPTLAGDGFEVCDFNYLVDPGFQAEAREVYGHFSPARNAVNKNCRGLRWGVYTHDTFFWLMRNTYSLSAIENPQEKGNVREIDLVPDTFLQNPMCERLFRDVFNRWNFEADSFHRAYECQLSAIRYEPTLAGSAEPTPPYPHHDVVDGAVVVLNRQDVLGGINRIFDNEGRPLYEFALEPGSGFLIVDGALMHYVTDLQLPIGARKGFRDILIVRFQPLGR